MPLYPYECLSCGISFEVLLGFSEEGPEACPSCGGEGPVRLFGVPSAIVRGVESAKTLGSLAEENTRRLIADKGPEEARRIIREKVYGAGNPGPAIGPAAREEKKKDVPWWRSGAVPGTGPRSEKPLDPASVRDPGKYVATGEKN